MYLYHLVYILAKRLFIYNTFFTKHCNKKLVILYNYKPTLDIGLYYIIQNMIQLLHNNTVLCTTVLLPLSMANKCIIMWLDYMSINIMCAHAYTRIRAIQYYVFIIVGVCFIWQVLLAYSHKLLNKLCSLSINTSGKRLRWSIHELL